MKFVFLAGTLGGGGAERQLYLLSEALHTAGHDISVISFSSGDYYEKRLAMTGINVITVDSKNNLKRLRVLYKLHKNKKPDFLMSFHFYINIYATMLGRILNVPSVGSVRSDGIQELMNNGYIASIINYHTPTFFLGNSENGLRNLRKALGSRGKVDILNNIVEPNEKKRNINQQSDKTVLLFVGRFYPIKRPELFLQLIRMLELQAPGNFTGMMVGDGPLRGGLEEEAIKSNLPVKFMGFSENVDELMRYSDFLVSTSLREGSPNVILEAMSVGLRCIVLNNGCYEKWIKLGLIESYTNLNEMASSLILHEHKPENMTLSIDYITKAHSKEQVISDYLNFFKSHV